MTRPADRGFVLLLAAYAIAALLLVSVSARLWWQTPLTLMPHEFDYFLGLFASNDEAVAGRWILLGRILHVSGCLIVGLLFLALVKWLLRSPQAMDERGIAAYAAVLSLIFAFGMPWLSPDVFFYIGTGWVESHYGLSPYLASVAQVPGYANDEMFSNIFPGFLDGTTSYGPLFQKLAALLAGLSGGSEKLALALHKTAGLALHAASSFVVWRLAPIPFRRVALFSYAANPLICFSILTCAHNDHWMNVFVLLALLAVTRRYWLLAGLALGASFGIKYFSLLYAPVFGLAALVQQQEGGRTIRNVADAARFTAGFAAAVVLVYLPYPEAVQAFSNVATSSISVYRNSVYHFLTALTALVLPNVFGLPAFFPSYQNVGRLLSLAYLAPYGIVLLMLLDQMRRDTLRGCAEACLAVTVLYFLLVNTSNQEWYLTWLIGLALVLSHHRAHSLAWQLSVFFLPLVIFTIKSSGTIVFYSNVALYCVLLVLGGLYLARLWRSQRPKPQPRPKGSRDIPLRH